MDHSVDLFEAVIFRGSKYSADFFPHRYCTANLPKMAPFCCELYNLRKVDENISNLIRFFFFCR